MCQAASATLGLLNMTDLIFNIHNLLLQNIYKKKMWYASAGDNALKSAVTEKTQLVWFQLNPMRFGSLLF